MSKNNLKLAAFLIGAIAAPIAAIAYLYRRPLPKVNGTLKVAGLRAPVEIIRDKWGVPHIYAQNLDDLFFAQGYVHAQDRLWQLELNRRVGHGRLSEIVGEIAFDTDRLLRTLGFARAAQNDWVHTDAETARILKSYALGVNTYVGANRNRLPLEFTLLGFKPAPWEPVDSLAWGKMMAWGLSYNWDNELLQGAFISRLGAARAAQLHGGYSSDNPLILADHSIGELLEQIVAQFDAAQQWLPVTPIEGASNNWVVDGAKSVTGKPLLANDPHLPLQMPAIWYENHLVAPELEVTGVSFPGTPGVVLGHNRDIAWGFTNAGPDVQDLYVEKINPDDPTEYEFQGHWEKATVIREEIRVKGQAVPHIEEVRVTRHGPVLPSLLPPSSSKGEGMRMRSLALSLRWVAHEESHLFRAVLGINCAHDWAEFTNALRDWDVPSQNMVFADREGNIGYYMPGRIPIRAKGNGMTPVPGWTGEYEWVGWVPHEELPHAFNPARHYVATANNLVVGKEYPHFLTGEPLNGYRARRIVELLEEKERLSADDFARIQTDQFCRPAEAFCRLVNELAPQILAQPILNGTRGLAAIALDQLKQWDYNLTAGSVPGAIYKLMQYFAMHRVFEPWLGELTDHYIGVGFAPILHDLSTYFVDHTPLVLERILENNDAAWLNPPPEAAGLPENQPRAITREQVLAGALSDAIIYLREMLGADTTTWQWGKIHQGGLNHPLGIQKPLDKLLSRGPFPIGGDSNTVWQANYVPKLPFKADSFSASWRQIIDLSDWDASRVVLTSGQSGHPASKHYDDMVRLWRKGEYHPLLWSRSLVDINAEARLRLE